jgi:hypothetical protein
VGRGHHDLLDPWRPLPGDLECGLDVVGTGFFENQLPELHDVLHSSSTHSPRFNGSYSASRAGTVASLDLPVDADDAFQFGGHLENLSVVSTYDDMDDSGDWADVGDDEAGTDDEPVGTDNTGLGFPATSTAAMEASMSRRTMGLCVGQAYPFSSA